MSYESEEEVNIRLYRHIKSGNEYNSLIPKSDCKRIDGGKGNTSYSVSQMVSVVKEYSHQMRIVAQKLKTSSLESTIRNIQDFAFWHYQYKIDSTIQQLRSPACAWEQRKDGIDCKSYSIVVASLLRELGIKSYFRRVAYETGKPYGHVYNVIPKDQKSGRLTGKDSYYIIDGTLNIDIEKEPYYYDKSDIKMETGPLDHYILAKPNLRGLGVANSQLSGYEKLYLKQRGLYQTNNGLGASDSGIVDIAKDIIGGGGGIGGIIGSIKSFLGGIFSSNESNSAFKTKHIEANIETLFNWIGNDILEINKFLEQKDYLKFSRQVRGTYMRYFWIEVLFRERQPDGWNSWTTKMYGVQIDFVRNNVDLVLKALSAWIDEYFDITETDSYSIDFSKPGGNNDYVHLGQTLLFSSAGPKMGIFETGQSEHYPTWYRGVKHRYPQHVKALFQPKPNKTIPFFELTDDLITALTSGATTKSQPTLDINKYISDLLDKGTIFYSNGNTAPNSGNQSGSNNNTGSGNNKPNTSITSSGSGMKIAGAGLLIAAIAFGASQLKTT